MPTPAALILCMIAFQPVRAAPPTTPPASVVVAVPPDLVLRDGETYVRSVLSGDTAISAAHVVRRTDGMVAVSWRGVRSPWFESFDETLPESDGGIRFREGGMQFRAVRGGQSYTMPIMENVPDLGWVMLVGNRTTGQLSLVYDGGEYPAFEIEKIVPGKEPGTAYYASHRTGTTSVYVHKGKVCLGGSPGYLVLMTGQDVYIQILDGGSRVQFWVQKT